MPTGVMPLPQDSSGTIQSNEWEFHYNNWDDSVVPHTTPVEDDKQFTPESKQYLDKDVLR